MRSALALADDCLLTRLLPRESPFCRRSLPLRLLDASGKTLDDLYRCGSNDETSKPREWLQITCAWRGTNSHAATIP